MLQRQSITFIFFLILGSTSSQYFGLIKLIKRIQNQCDSSTISFVNFNGNFLSIFSQENPKIPVYILNNLEIEYDKFPNVILVIQVLENESIQNDKVLEKIIPKLRVRKCVIVFGSNSINLEQSFSFLASNNFRLILGIADNISYAYFPFADNKMQKFSRYGPFPQPLKDLNGFTIRTTCAQEAPRLARLTGKNSKTEILGFLGKLFLSFIKKHNATFREILSPLTNRSLSHREIMNAGQENRIDISMNGFFPQSIGICSYPIKIITSVLRVPWNGYLDTSEFFIRPFSPGVWLCIGIFVIYVTLMKILVNKCLEKDPEYWYSFSTAFSATLMLSPEKTVTNQYCLHIQIFIFTFLIATIYAIYFTSFLTVFIKIKQFDTLQDLVDRKLPVLIASLDYEGVKKTNPYPKQFMDLLVPIGYAEYVRDFLPMANISIAFVMGEDKVDFYSQIERSLREPWFRKAKERLNNFLFSYIITPHSVFEDILNDCILKIQESGLIHKWDSDFTYQFVVQIQSSFGLENTFKATHAPLSVGHFMAIWIGWAFGLILGLFVFVWECLGNIIYQKILKKE
ncbi:uncharacterized protein LOC129908426 [Episyrphus balteatus]|uniref:uncharacterized protein LOC129908426 n=1 Tax=Episyrphus balteatus TaxID=286459 RepID=UPI00248538AA|nr:uncharacterized protein LOC129908426 [Episyrphus balteatus]